MKVKKKGNDQNFARNSFLRVKLHISRFKILKNPKNPKIQKNPKIHKSKKSKGPKGGPKGPKEARRAPELLVVKIVPFIFPFNFATA